MAWKRSDWNGIIQRINELSTNPTSGHTALDPLEEVPEDHKWSVNDINIVRNRLLEFCPENTFIADTIKWTQDLIDEIETAIAAGWCFDALCSENGTVIEIVVPDSDGTTFSDWPYPTYSTSALNCPEFTGPQYLFAETKAATFFNGMQVARAGVSGRKWEAWRVNYNSAGEKISETQIYLHPYDQEHSWNQTQGVIDCDGVIRDADRDSYNVLCAQAYGYWACVGTDIARTCIEIRIICTVPPAVAC